MENPASASSLPSEQLPRVASGLESGFAPSIQPGPTPGPSPSEILERSGPLPLSGVSASQPDALPSAPEPTGIDNEVDVSMEIPPNEIVSPPDTPSDDEPMEPALPPANAASHPNTDPRPTMADVLAQQELLRRDNAEADAVRRRVETPKPLACDIEAIERQYAAGSDWSFIAPRMEQARPYALPRSKYDMVIDTGRTLAKTPLQKIMASLSGKNHGNEALEDLYQRYEIGQISKLPGGNLRVKVKSKEACLLLERTKVNILGGVFTFKEFDVLGGKYFLDIANVDSDTDTDVILHRLFLLGCKPVYDTFREVNLATGITSATWRVYFLSTSCPSALMVNGSVCDQVLFDNKLHPAHGKNAPFQSERLPYGYRSHHGLDLGTSDSVSPSSGPVTEPARQKQQQQQQQHQPKTYAQAANAKPMPKQTSLQKAVEEAKKREGQPQHGAQHGQQSVANQLAKLPSNSDDALSISTFNGSNGKITPPGSPKAPKKLLLLTNGPDDGFATVSKNKKKRSRNAIDFSNLMVKQSAQPLNGIATSNYFQALQSMEVKFKSKNATADKKYGVRHQILPVDVKRPAELKTSTESAFFVEKHHTKIRKASKASPLLEVTESMLNDENTALLNTLPDCLAEADKKVEGVCKLLENATNPDHITKKAIESPLAFNSALSLKMAGSGHEIAEVAQLHVINRVLCATHPNDDTTFSTKWKKLMGTAVPSKRADIIKTCAKWWTTSDSIKELTRASKALGFFELMLMSIAPTIFANDHWIQYLTGQPVEWIPAHNARLLHPNTLLRLLRSELGSHCMQQWSEVQWQGHLLDDLESLQKLEGFYPEDSSVLQLQFAGGEVTMVAGGLATRC
ncbi:hypothetical protein FI667_g14138, partial [Globisporangium splendens]